jgi:hypothetical protein
MEADKKKYFEKIMSMSIIAITIALLIEELRL